MASRLAEQVFAFRGNQARWDAKIDPPRSQPHKHYRTRPCDPARLRRFRCARLAVQFSAIVVFGPEHMKKTDKKLNVKRAAPKRALKTDFDQVVALIHTARDRAFKAVNTALIDLYWKIGGNISRKIEDEGWGKGTVEELADYIHRRQPNARGFSARNLWRMMQLFETYRGSPILSPLVTELSWTHHLVIMSRSKTAEEREFYLRICVCDQWPKRELERQLDSGLFERTILSPAKLSPVVTVLHPGAESAFKDSYSVEFLDLRPGHSESDLHGGLMMKLQEFLIELGRDFCFVGSHYPLQVGKRDFELDLLFFHRGLNCLVAIELKVGEFCPEHLGKLEFYLEALDQNVKKPHEQPAVGVLLCATKDREVVEYALRRSMSPTLVAEYRTRLPDKNMLEAKLREFYETTKKPATIPPPPTAGARTMIRARRPRPRRLNRTR